MPQRKKNTRSRKSSSKLKKAKVYIPAYKVIMLCVGIITICMALLLITTVSTPKEEPKIAIKKEAEVKEIKNTKAETPKKVETTKQTEQKKETPKEPEVSKPVKIETPQVKQQEIKQPEVKVAPPKVETPKVQPQVETKPQPKVEKPKEIAPSKPDYNFPMAKNGAQLIFVFDDGGQNLNHLKPFLQLPFPFTVAVLPDLAHSVETAAQVRRSGNEVILHQPMQSISPTVNPGPGAIKPGMTESEITALMFHNINQIGPIAGLNNHEGSAITADAEMMAVVMRVASESGIYFLDSRTNVETKVPYVAGELGYSYYERNGYFLDNEKTKENALKELRRNLDIANKTGSVIMIGHIWSADFLPAFLQEVYPELVKKGYTFSVVSKSKARK